MEVIEHPRLQYRVQFGQAEAVLYHEEMTNGKQRNFPIRLTDNQVEWYIQKEVADLLGVCKATIYHYSKTEENH
ncbi:hypothetical protein [Peribacillus simplex]|uniref:hypothetical protein n=1 Tax=Peribacillus simplex TaxID=1478 RepID=UPI003D292C19